MLAEAGGVRNWVERGHALDLGWWLSRIALGTCRAQGTLWGVVSRAHIAAAESVSGQGSELMV